MSTVRVWNSLEFYLFGSPIWQTGVVSPDPLTQSGFSQLSGLPRTGAQLENVHVLGTKAQDPGLPIWGSWSYKKEGKTPFFHFQHKETQLGPWKMEGHWLLLGCESINLKSLEAGALSTLAGSPRQWLALRTNPGLRISSCPHPGRDVAENTWA